MYVQLSIRMKTKTEALTLSLYLMLFYFRGGYLCICMPGYNGTNCENDIDECQLHKPCNSTGTKMCNDSINDYNCTCKPGFTGKCGQNEHVTTSRCVIEIGITYLKSYRGNEMKIKFPSSPKSPGSDK